MTGSSPPPPSSPDGFIWGSAGSAAQWEGAAPHSDIARWETEGRFPPSGDGNGFGTRFAEDFRLLAELGLPHHRLTLDWSRLEPIDGVHDPEAVEHYLAVLDAARDAGVAVWASIHHRCSPGWFADDLGGFADDRARSYHWPRHVDWLAETFGDRVAGWTGINQPVNFAVDGWFRGTMPPGRVDVTAFASVLESLLLADHHAWTLLRSDRTPVACVLNLSPVYPVVPPDYDGPGNGDAEARSVARSYDDTLFGVWLRALSEGLIDVPGRPRREMPELADTYDLVGFTYYSAISAHPDGSTGQYPDGLPTDDFARPQWPEGLGLVLRRLHDELPGRPLLVAEYGVATDDDALRAETLNGLIDVTMEARADGVDVRGMFLWSPIDAWEWERGFGVHFGIVDRDRNLRPSATVLRDRVTR